MKAEDLKLPPLEKKARVIIQTERVTHVFELDEVDLFCETKLDEKFSEKDEPPTKMKIKKVTITGRIL